MKTHTHITYLLSAWVIHGFFFNNTHTHRSRRKLTDLKEKRSIFNNLFGAMKVIEV